MRTLYFDCFAGASGDMILGALVGVGVEPRLLRERLALLNVSGYEVEFESVDRSGLGATRAHVRTAREHAHRHLADILKIIDESSLSANVKERASKIFTRLGEAEARVHNLPVDAIHFHEVGALDAIIDVVGACIGFEALGVERFVSSALHVGSGWVEMAHGRFPVPPPAVTELLKGAPVYSTDVTGELLTPTGAAIISTVCEEYGAMPRMRIEGMGYGAGAREYERFPNVLRVMVGDDEEAFEAGADERLLMIETNIDDMSPQLFGNLMERAFESGALDCYFTPVQMKKNRPGVLVSLLCRTEDRAAMCELLFTETTTLGVRVMEVARRALERESRSVQTPYGPIDVKVARTRSDIKYTPEYEQCRAAAQRAGVTLRQVEAAAREAFKSGSRE